MQRSGVRSMGWRRRAPRLTARALQLSWRKLKVTEQGTALRRSVHARARRCALPAGRADQGRARQPVDPFAQRARWSLSRARSAPPAAPAGVPLHPKSTEAGSTQHGGDRDRCACAASASTGRVAKPERLVSEIAAWKRQRNAAGARIKWMFTTERTCAKLARIPGSKQ
jgi:hypothetical protein